MRYMMVLLQSIIIFVCCASFASANNYPIAHITAGSPEWNTVLQVDNHASTAHVFMLALYQNGAVVYSQTYQIQGHGYQNFNLKSLSANADSGQIFADSDQMSFRLCYEQLYGRGKAEFVLDGETHTSVSFLFSNAFTGVEWKGLSVFNPNEQPATVTLSAIGGGGILQQVVTTIAPYSKLVGYHSSWFPNLGLGQIERITAVSDMGLCGVTITGDNACSKLLFSPAVEAKGFPNSAASNDFSGTWTGTWTSTNFQTTHTVNMYAVQAGNTLSGTLDVTGTECGTLTNVPFTGTISGNTITVQAITFCSGAMVTLQYTNGVRVGNQITGPYQIFVNGDSYDSGTYILNHP